MTAPLAPRAARGFTLIELMITVAIVALLASIAYPAYTDSVRKGRRAEGRTALIELMQQQERYLTQTGSYLSFTQGATGTPFKTTSGNAPAQAAYQLGAESCGGSPAPPLSACVRVFAVPTRSDPEAGTLGLRSTGQRDCTGTNSSICWR